MSSSNKNSGKGLILIIGYVFVAYKSATIAWDWVEPSGFFSFILFSITWTVLGWIGGLILMFISSQLES